MDRNDLIALPDETAIERVLANLVTSFLFQPDMTVRGAVYHVGMMVLGQRLLAQVERMLISPVVTMMW